VHLIRERPRRMSDADGFTLIELVISVAILGIVSASLLGIVLQYAKTTKDTSARLNESTDEQFVSTYWQNDVSSLGLRSLTLASAATFTTDPSVFVGSAGPGGCGSALGSVVVAFGWNEFTVGTTAPADPWTSTPQRVAYVTVPNGSRLLLQRVRCKNSVAGTPLTVAHNLTAVPTISCDTSCGSTSLPGRVSMTFTVKDAANAGSQGYTTTVSADRRQG
jgi:prepilin-type N-terminal cleavage/methylation domain-containing protein